jgi:putative Holliday junction resolvase
MPEPQVVLGFDYGIKRIGVALGQCLLGSTRPLCILTPVRQAPDWLRIEALIREWQPGLLLVGLPLDLDDSPTHATEPAQRFSRQLSGRFHLPVELIDERLTSKIARQELGNKAGKGLDAMAAALIIQTWMTDHALSDPKPLQH